MPKLTVLAAFTSVMLFAACMPLKAHEKPGVQSATRWQFESFNCAFECDSTLEEVLNDEIGKSLDFAKLNDGFSLFTTCNGQLFLKVKVEPSVQVLRQLNQTIHPGPQFTRENTGLSEQETTTAEAICQEGERSFTTFWVVNLSHEKMTVYYEGGSFLHFRSH